VFSITVFAVCSAVTFAFVICFNNKESSNPLGEHKRSGEKKEGRGKGKGEKGEAGHPRSFQKSVPRLDGTNKTENRFGTPGEKKIKQNIF